MTDEEYVKLAWLLDEAAREHRELATVSGDPVERYQARVNADFFTAARNAAKDHQSPSDRIGFACRADGAGRRA